MNPALHAFFLDAEASSHPVHADIVPLYRRLSDQAGDTHELIAYADEFDGLLEDVRDHVRNPDEDLDPAYLARLAEFHGALRAIDAHRARVSDLHIEIRQSLEEVEELCVRHNEGLLADDDPSWESWLEARQGTLAEVERLRADPVMVPHLDRILTNLPELADIATPPTLAEAARAAMASPEPAAREAASAANRMPQSVIEAASGPAPEPGLPRPHNVLPEPARPPAPASAAPRLVWAGIGSRGNDREPMSPSVLADMTELARRMAADGWHLSSGGSDGSDTAFANGTPGEQRTIWLPWPGYNNLSGPDCHPIPPDRLQQALELAERFHPAWESCKQGTRKLHARNGLILLGRDLDRPVHAVVAYTRGGQLQGGTAQGLRIAMEHNIPIFNLGSMTMEEAWKGLQELRRSLTASRSHASPGEDGAEPETGRSMTKASGARDAGREEGMARVLHLRNAPPDAIRIDRKTRWGNPFIIGRDGTREEVIAKYRDRLWNSIRAGEISMDDLAGLHGKDLACHCAPQPCHGDVLSKAAAWAHSQRNRTETRTAGDDPVSPKAAARESAAETADRRFPASLGLVTNHRRLLEAGQDGWLRPPEGQAFLLAGDGSVSEALPQSRNAIPVRLAFDPVKLPFPALRRELADAGAEADPAAPLAWRAPIPLFALARIEVGSEEHKARLLGMAGQFGNVSLPAIDIAVAGRAIEPAADRPAFTSQVTARELPERLNAIQGALAMAAARLPGEEGWTDILRHVLNRDPARSISDPANANRDWFALPWVPRTSGMPARGMAADQRRLWDAAMSCLRWPAAQGLPPSELAGRIAETASAGAANPEADRWLAQTQRIIDAEESIDPSAPFDERAGLAIQLALLRPDPDRFSSWTAEAPDIPQSVAWAGAVLCGWRHGYRDLDNAFRGDAALQETVANAALAAAVPSAYAPVWAGQQETAAAAPDTWQHIKAGYAALYRASGDRLHHLPRQEGFAEFAELVAGTVRDGGCPERYRSRLEGLHETLQTQDSRHNTVLAAQRALDDVGARLAGLKEKMEAEPGHAIETMPGYTAWLRERDTAVETWRKLSEDPAHKDHVQAAAPDMMAPRIAELSSDNLHGIHRANMDQPIPASGQGVYTPSLQPLSQVWDRALAFVDRDPKLLAYAPQFDELKDAVSAALDECRHAPDLLDRLTTLRTALDDSHERMTRARAASEDVASASETLCRMKSWSDSTGRPIHEAPNFRSCREDADRALRHYEAAQKDPALVLHLARADSLGVLAETALPLLQDPRFREPVVSEAALARQRSEQAEEQFSMSA